MRIRCFLSRRPGQAIFCFQLLRAIDSMLMKIIVKCSILQQNQLIKSWAINPKLYLLQYYSYDIIFLVKSKGLLLLHHHQGTKLMRKVGGPRDNWGLHPVTYSIASIFSYIELPFGLYVQNLMPYPRSPFYDDIKSDIRFGNRFDVRLWISFHVNYTIRS